METNTFLQLRQKTSEEVYGNGDYATQLRKPITLVEGDQLLLNKAIIDSRDADSGSIVLHDDITMGFNFYYYLTNFDTDDKYTDDNRNHPIASSKVDLNNYVFCSKNTPSGYELY